ncbi:hypothetical protein PFX98_12590 [Paucibacter sediminis]|uniref:Uncharacterized protein n=1 Tax=Paucibacter sediminis TaxID=3019553 RepID=A0AA95NCY3_9BURK|nr:hypothetical protein [Paucibacter sp. S2-9]WIT09783.1 hypothetical protein PFX98_12590 [Paucibacter sp. S2-9]
MRSEVKVVFDVNEQVDLVVDASEVLSYDAARQWLDEQFVKHGCEPMRGSGKVLIADKILAVANAVGPQALRDPAFGLDYARAASGALSKALLKVDIPKLSVSY